jgi:DNA-binding transcriptional MerR regulator
MSYTVNKLAKLSGVSPRTLRHYDDIGLLKPAFHGDNKYRYYEENQILLLQQILFFRELGFPLSDIKRILNSDDFNQLESLKTHKATLQSKLDRTESMIKTIDKTILHLKGKLTMNVEEFFDPIRLRDSEIQQEYENYLVEKGILSQAEMDESWEKIKNWTKADWDKFKGDGDIFYRKMVDAMQSQYTPASSEVQQLVHQHYLLIKPLWLFDQQSYIKLAESYREDLNFKKFCALYDPKLLEFLVESMITYAEQTL